jgi:hypothetical protein
MMVMRRWFTKATEQDMKTLQWHPRSADAIVPDESS